MSHAEKDKCIFPSSLCKCKSAPLLKPLVSQDAHVYVHAYLEFLRTVFKCIVLFLY